MGIIDPGYESFEGPPRRRLSSAVYVQPIHGENLKIPTAEIQQTFSSLARVISSRLRVYWRQRGWPHT